MTNLGLGYCGISDAAAKEIVELVKVSGGLTTLDLAQNSITDVGAQALAASGFGEFLPSIASS